MYFYAGGTLSIGLTTAGALKAYQYLNHQTATGADPTITEYPADKDFGVHKNTSSGDVFLAYNDSGTIKKVQLT